MWLGPSAGQMPATPNSLNQGRPAPAHAKGLGDLDLSTLRTSRDCSVEARHCPADAQSRRIPPCLTRWRTPVAWPYLLECQAGQAAQFLPIEGHHLVTAAGAGLEPAEALQPEQGVEFWHPGIEASKSAVSPDFPDGSPVSANSCARIPVIPGFPTSSRRFDGQTSWVTAKPSRSAPNSTADSGSDSTAPPSSARRGRGGLR